MGVVVVHTFGTTAVPNHGVEGLRADEPAVQLLSSFAERILEALLGSSTEPVQRYTNPSFLLRFYISY
jgi:hypothetical protein